MKYFLDTEFDGFGGPLISLALVREDGDSLYLVYQETATQAWVQENVLPILWDIPEYAGHKRALNETLVTRRQGARMIADFFADRGGVPYVITDWPDDVRYLCQAIITGPGEMAAIPRLQFDIVRVDAYPTDLPDAVQHNAWWDAMALREKLLGLGLPPTTGCTCPPGPCRHDPLDQRIA